MSLKSKIYNFKKDPSLVFKKLCVSKVARIIPDKWMLKIQYRLYLKKTLNLTNPQGFNEKIQWLKLYNRRPEYILMVDKFEAKKYVAERIGSQYIIPTIGAWNRFDDIDIDALPQQFVLKCTHDSKSTIICKNKKVFDYKTAGLKLKEKLNNNLFWWGREWAYKDAPPRIIAEEYLVDDSGDEPKDYKIFCFNGEPRAILVCAERFTDEGLRENFYDLNWNLLNLQRPKHPNAEYSISKPDSLDAMLSLARTLSQKIPFVRVDFYDIHGKIYFGEMTFYPASGFEGFVPEEWDYKLGEWIKLPEKT